MPEATDRTTRNQDDNCYVTVHELQQKMEGMRIVIGEALSANDRLRGEVRDLRKHVPPM